MDQNTVITALLGVCGFFLALQFFKLDKIADNVMKLVANEARRDEQIKNLTNEVEELKDRITNVETDIKLIAKKN